MNMKRFYLFAIAMVSALSMLAETNVQNTFFGCTLGKSTTEEVQNAITAQGFKLHESIDSIIHNDTYEIHFSRYDYEGEYDHEGLTFHTIGVSFLNDTFFAILMQDSCNGSCVKYSKIVQEKLNKKYGSLEIADSTLLFKQITDSAEFWGIKTWSRHDEHTMVMTSSSDTIYGCSYISEDMYYNLLLSGLRQLVDEFNNLPNYCEKNRVYGVAGVKFGDNRETVRRIIGLKSDRLLDSDSHTLQYYNTTIGGTIYEHTTFYFANGKLVSVDLQKPFFSWRKEEALMAFENIKSQYERKYSNLKMTTDKDEEKYCLCGAYIDGYDYPPIFISFQKSLSKGGDIMYYVGVSYYVARTEHLYDDEI